MTATLTPTRLDLAIEFDRQVEGLMQRGYPQAAGVSAEEFRAHVEPLKAKIGGLSVPDIDLEQGRLPFAIVIKSELVSAPKAMSLVEREGKTGLTKLYPREPEDFQPIDGASLPGGMAYLLVDIDRGNETINVVPDEALRMIAGQHRSPLTLDEGIAILTHHPAFLRKNHCFSLLGSRMDGDRRVPAIWINSDKRPHLGWCWAGNPHTWLGSASCGGRIGA